MSANTTNKVQRMLSAVLETAVEYELVPTTRPVVAVGGYPARSPNARSCSRNSSWLFSRQARSSTPVAGARCWRSWLGPVSASKKRSRCNGQDVNLARGHLSVVKSKTDAGVRVVDLTPALRDELALWMDCFAHKRPTDLVFPTQRGHTDTRQNVRARLLVKSIKKANEKLVAAGIEPIAMISPHGLRRTYASLRCVCDDPVYVASQLGHTDPSFTLRVYAQAVRHRSKLTQSERAAFDQAVVRAQVGADRLWTTSARS